MHAFGLAVDVNPRENPYVGCGQSRDPATRRYLDRSIHRRGMVTRRAIGAFRSAGLGLGRVVDRRHQGLHALLVDRPLSNADLTIRLQPRAKRNAILDEREGVLRVSVAAAPVDGQANAALCKLIAKRAGVPRTRVTIVRGERSRDKVVRIEGMALADARAALGL